MKKIVRGRLKSRIRQATNNPSIKLLQSVSYTSNKTGRWEASIVTFTFDKPYRCGQFCTGEWWVCPDNPGESITITSITPDEVLIGGNVKNGAQVDTEVNKQSFEQNLQTNGWTPEKKITYPISINASTGPRSVVKGVSYTDWVHKPEGEVQPDGSIGDSTHRPLKFAAILTVLNSPLENSHLYFRPSFVGDPTNAEVKRIFEVDDINPSVFPGLNVNQTLYPQLKGQIDKINYSSLAKQWCCAKLDYWTDWNGRYIHPGESWNGHSNVYGSEVANHITYSIYALCFDKFNYSTIDQKKTLWGILQYAIDLRAGILSGQRWYGNGGHLSGRKLPLLLAEKTFTTTGSKFRDAIIANEGTATASITAASFSNSGGVAVLTLTAPSHGVSAMRVVKIKDASNTAYNGHCTVKKVIDANTIEVWPWSQVDPGVWGTGTLHKPELFQEDDDTYYSWATGTKTALWGSQHVGLGEYYYYQEIGSGSGARTCRDPYGLIDGGSPGYNSQYSWIGGQANSYQICCTTSQYNYAATIARILKLQDAWDYPPFFDYVDRVFKDGIIAYDTVAPFDETNIITVASTTGVQVGDRLTSVYNAPGTSGVPVRTGIVTEVVSSTKVKLKPVRQYTGTYEDAIPSWGSGAAHFYRGATLSNGIVSGGTLVLSTTVTAARQQMLGLTYGIATTTDNGHVIGEVIQGSGRVPNNHNLRANRIVASIEGDLMTVSEHFGEPIKYDMIFNGSSVTGSFKVTATNAQSGGYTGTGGTGTYRVNTPVTTSISNKKFYFAAYGYGQYDLALTRYFEQDLDPRFVNLSTQVNKTESETVTSEWVKVGTIGASKAISISGGINSQYRISNTGLDDPAWTSSPGTISSGQFIQVKADSAATELTNSQTSIVIDGFTNYYTISTGYFVQYSKIESDIQTWSIKTVSVTSMSWAAGVLTINATAHGFNAGQRFWLNVTSGTTTLNTATTTDGYLISTVPNANQLTVNIAEDPGALTVTTGKIHGVVAEGGYIKVGGAVSGTIYVGSRLNGYDVGWGDISSVITGEGTSVNGIVSYPASGFGTGSRFPTTTLNGIHCAWGATGDGSFNVTSMAVCQPVYSTTYTISDITAAQDGLSSYYIWTITTTVPHNLSLEDKTFIYGVTAFNTTDGTSSRVIEIVDSTSFKIRRTTNPGVYSGGCTLYPPTYIFNLNWFGTNQPGVIVPGMSAIGNGSTDNFLNNVKILPYGTYGTTGTGGSGTYAVNKQITARTGVNHLVNFKSQDFGGKIFLLALRYKSKDSTDVLLSQDQSGNSKIFDNTRTQIGGSNNISYMHANDLNYASQMTTRWFLCDLGRSDRTTGSTKSAYFDGVNKIYGLSSTGGYYPGMRFNFTAGLVGSATITAVDTFSKGSFTIDTSELSNPTYTGAVSYNSVTHRKRGILTASGKTGTITGVDCAGLYKFLRLTKATWNVSSASWAANEITFVSDKNNNIQSGDTIVIAGVSPSAYNGTYTVNSIVGAKTFKVTLNSDPGTYTSGGTISGNGNLGSENWIKSVDDLNDTITIESTTTLTSGTIHLSAYFGALVQWWEQGNVFQKSTGNQFTTYDWNVDNFNDPQPHDYNSSYPSTIVQYFLGSWNARSNFGAGIFEFLWVDWAENVDDLPDVTDPEVRSRFRASKIGPNGEVTTGRIPKLFWAGSASEYNTNGIENKGRQRIWTRSVYQAANNPATLTENGITLGTLSTYTGSFIRIISGKGAGQVRKILSHNNTTFTLESNWTDIPDATSVYQLEISRRFRNVGSKAAY